MATGKVYMEDDHDLLKDTESEDGEEWLGLRYILDVKPIST